MGNSISAALRPRCDDITTDIVLDLNSERLDSVSEVSVPLWAETICEISRESLSYWMKMYNGAAAWILKTPTHNALQCFYASPGCAEITRWRHIIFHQTDKIHSLMSFKKNKAITSRLINVQIKQQSDYSKFTRLHFSKSHCISHQDLALIYLQAHSIIYLAKCIITRLCAGSVY